MKIQPKQSLNYEKVRKERFESMTIEELKALQDNYLNAASYVTDSSVISMVCNVIKEMEKVIQDKMK
jgi:hypothetical protein